MDDRCRKVDNDEVNEISTLISPIDDDNDVITSKRDEISAKFGRRASNQFKVFIQNEDTIYDALTFDSISPVDDKQTSAKYGRRSLSNISSRSSSMVSSMLGENSNPSDTFYQNIESALDNDLINALEQCNTKSKESVSRKNSAKYGRRATSRNNSITSTENEKQMINGLSIPEFHGSSSFNFEITKPTNHRNKIKGQKDINFGYSNKILEESWSSLKVFNKKQKGRICEGNPSSFYRHVHVLYIHIFGYYSCIFL